MLAVIYLRKINLKKENNMFFVYLNIIKHSCWLDFGDAEKQISTLRSKNSYRRLEIRNEPQEDYFDGQYF